MLNAPVVGVNGLFVACKNNRELIVQQLEQFLIYRLSPLDVGSGERPIIKLLHFGVVVAFDLPVHKLQHSFRRIRQHRCGERSDIIIASLHFGHQGVKIGKDLRGELDPDRIEVLLGYRDKGIDLGVLGAQEMDRQLLPVLLADSVRTLGPTGFIEKLIGFDRVIGVWIGPFLRVSPGDRRSGDVGDLAGSLVGVHINALAVQTVGESLTNPFILERFMFQI
ncbi:hypothetical protein D1872_222110 [compost metagenome]